MFKKVIFGKNKKLSANLCDLGGFNTHGNQPQRYAEIRRDDHMEEIKTAQESSVDLSGLKTNGIHPISPPDGQPPPAPFVWDEDRRAVLGAELDAIYFHLYGLTREERRQTTSLRLFRL